MPIPVVDLFAGPGGLAAWLRQSQLSGGPGASLSLPLDIPVPLDTGEAESAIPGHLLTSVPAGPWIRLYSFQSTAVLNAQLQSVISLASYAADSEDAAAAGASATSVTIASSAWC